MRARQSIAWFLVTLFLIVSGIALAQDVSQNRTLVISGQPGNVPVIQVNGRSYVDLEALARVSNGSLSFAGNQIVLTLPGTSASATATPVAAPGPSIESGIFKRFFESRHRGSRDAKGMARSSRERHTKWKPGHERYACAVSRPGNYEPASGIDRNFYGLGSQCLSIIEQRISEHGEIDRQVCRRACQSDLHFAGRSPE